MNDPKRPNAVPDAGRDAESEPSVEESSQSAQVPKKRNPFVDVMRNVTDLASSMVLEGSTSIGRRGRPIGDILAAAGKLSTEDIPLVLAHQKEKNVLFGEAAVRLGLVGTLDVEQALARQFDYPYVVAGGSMVSRDVVAAYHPFGQQTEMLRALREELIARWIRRAGGGNAFAVVSPGRAEGRSYLAANLAVLFAQLGMRTLLVDADLRNPRQHKLFGLEGRNGLSAVLSGRGDATSVRQVVPFEQLSILPAGTVPPNPQELLAREEFAALIRKVERQVDAVIVDTPAGSHCADALSAAISARAALLVARADYTKAKDLASFENRLSDASVNVIGTVFNEA